MRGIYAATKPCPNCGSNRRRMEDVGTGFCCATCGLHTSEDYDGLFGKEDRDFLHEMRICLQPTRVTGVTQ